MNKQVLQLQVLKDQILKNTYLTLICLIED